MPHYYMQEPSHSSIFKVVDELNMLRNLNEASGLDTSDYLVGNIANKHKKKGVMGKFKGISFLMKNALDTTST